MESTPEAGIVDSNGGASGAARGTNHRSIGPRPIHNQATTTPVFEGSVPLLKGFYCDFPRELNHDQFSNTTKKMAIMMGSDMSVFARDLAMAFTNLDLVMPVPIVDPADDATPVQIHCEGIRRQDLGVHWFQGQVIPQGGRTMHRSHERSNHPSP